MEHHLASVPCAVERAGLVAELRDEVQRRGLGAALRAGHPGADRVEPGLRAAITPKA